MIEFFESHQGLLPVIVGLVLDIVLTILCLIFRKKGKTKDYVINLIDEVLPGFICLAEESGCDGISKLSMVIDLVLKRIKKFIVKDDFHFYKSLIIEKVEAILSTPQKKESK